MRLLGDAALCASASVGGYWVCVCVRVRVLAVLTHNVISVYLVKY